MTARTVYTGGTDWNNEQVTDTDLNDTVGGVSHIYKANKTATTTDAKGYVTFATFGVVPRHTSMILHWQAGGIVGATNSIQGVIMASGPSTAGSYGSSGYFDPLIGAINLSGFHVFTSGTDYTIGTAGSFSVLGEENDSGTVSYYSSYLEGQNL